MSVEFKGEEFAPKGAVNRMRTLYLAKVARDNQKRLTDAEKRGDTDAAGEAMMHINAALYDLVQSVLRPDDFERFMAACDEQGVDDAELYAFAGQMMGAAAERPTERSSDSSAGPSTTPVSSESRAEALVTERFVGRPDMQMAALANQRADEQETAKVLDLWQASA